MKNKLIFGIGLIFLMFLGLAIVTYSEEHKDVSEFIYFRWGGGYSPISFEEVKIMTDGNTMVRVQVFPKKRLIEKVFQLDQKELEYFKVLIKNADFFNLPEVKMFQIIDAGSTILRVSLAGKTREITFQQRSELEEITSSLWKLAHQGLIVDNLERGKKISHPCGYEALASLSPYLGGVTVFQPGALIEPLENFISSLNIKEEAEQKNLFYAVQALVWITKPEEWGGFLSLYISRLDDSLRYKFFEFVPNGFSGDIPKTYINSARMLQTNFLNSEYQNWTKLPKERQKVLLQIIFDLRFERYTPAIPILINITQEAQSQELKEKASSSLGWMGKAAIVLTSRLLYNSNSQARIDAISVFVKMFDSCFSMVNPIGEDEQKDMLRLLKYFAIPKVQDMVKQDIDNDVRQKAETLLRRFESEWNLKMVK